MNIFCVDTDYARLMKLWRDALKVMPTANVQTFREMGEVVRYAMSNRCDVLLAEMNPGRAAWNGADLAGSIEKLNPRVNVIFFSTEPPEQNARMIRNIKVSGYIQRPYDAARLSEELAHLRYMVEE